MTQDIRLWVPPEDPTELAQAGMEVWVPFGTLLVSNLGRVLRAQRWSDDPDVQPTNPYVELKPFRRGRKTFAVSARPDILLHRLVAQAFGVAGTADQVFHRNRNGADNRLCNLHVGRPRLTGAQRNALEDALKGGARPADVARAFGLSTAHVAYYTNKARRADPSGFDS